MFRQLGCIVAAAAALCACSSTTTISVADPEARIYVNGEYVGTGRGRYSDRKPAFTKQVVMLRKEGCEAQRHSFRRNERPDLGAIVSAYYLALPILWFTQYKKHRAYDFDCFATTARVDDRGEGPRTDSKGYSN